MSLTETQRFRGLKLAHDLLDIADRAERRTTYIAPEYMADMSILNAELDTILNGGDEPSR